MKSLLTVWIHDGKPTVMIESTLQRGGWWSLLLADIARNLTRSIRPHIVSGQAEDFEAELVKIFNKEMASPTTEITDVKSS